MLEFPHQGYFEELQAAYQTEVGWNANVDYSSWPKDHSFLRFETLLKPKLGVKEGTRELLAAEDIVRPGDCVRVDFRTECNWSDDRLTLYPVLQFTHISKVDINAMWDDMPVSECEQRVIDKHGKNFW